jgi:hypothetical protein
MSIMQPPSPSRQKPTARTWLKDEWNHFAQMELLPFCLLALPSILLLPINPLLPPIAYALQRWAGATWAWRDRWASVWVWAKQAAWWSAILAGIVALGAWRIWLFPELITTMQAFWQAHLPGTLSLSPTDGQTLFARTLLLLPLAPMLALYYEWIDPRTRVRHRRVLTPADLAKPPQPTDPPPTPAAAPTPHQTRLPQAALQAPPPPPKAKQQIPTPPPAAQMTIDSFLTPDQAQTSPPPPSPTKAEPPPKKNTPPAEPLPPVTEDWNDMAE